LPKGDKEDKIAEIPVRQMRVQQIKSPNKKHRPKKSPKRRKIEMAYTILPVLQNKLHNIGNRKNVFNRIKKQFPLVSFFL
jgi:hypothetical protein